MEPLQAVMLLGPGPRILGREAGPTVWGAGRLGSRDLGAGGLRKLLLLLRFLSPPCACPLLLSSLLTVLASQEDAALLSQAQVRPLNACAHPLGQASSHGEEALPQVLVIEANGRRARTLKTHLLYVTISPVRKLRHREIR